VRRFRDSQVDFPS